MFSSSPPPSVCVQVALAATIDTCASVRNRATKRRRKIHHYIVWNCVFFRVSFAYVCSQCSSLTIADDCAVCPDFLRGYCERGVGACVCMCLHVCFVCLKFVFFFLVKSSLNNDLLSNFFIINRFAFSVRAEAHLRLSDVCKERPLRTRRLVSHAAPGHRRHHGINEINKRRVVVVVVVVIVAQSKARETHDDADVDAQASAHKRD